MMSKQPLVKTMRSPWARASSSATSNCSVDMTPRPAPWVCCTARRNSGALMAAVPSLPMTIPAARLASATANGRGDIVNFAGARWERPGGLGLSQQGHAMLAAGDQQRLQIQLGDQRHALVHQLLLPGAAAHHCLELGHVRRDQGRAAVDGKDL